ncbi:MAG: 5-oxoprolinase subunit PxpA [Ferruginibacter sp.]
MANIDINCDMGEAFGNYSMPNDALLFKYISSANIACGFHAGDATVMQSTVALAIQNNVAIGAHPGLQDLQGFGRREMKISPKEVYQITLYQIGALAAFVKAANAKLHHVKPHGALYNMAAKEIKLAQAIVDAMHDFDPSLILYGLAGSELINAACNKGLTSAGEAFADRTYQDDGSLTPRNQANAFITNEKVAAAQVLRLVHQQQVISVDQKIISLKADTLCIHGDGEFAVEFAKTIHHTLTNEGITIKTFSN